MKKKTMGFCLILIIFIGVFYHFAANYNLSAMLKVKTTLEENNYNVEIKESDKDVLQGERYRLVLNQNEDFVVTVYVYENEKLAAQDADTIREDGCAITQLITTGTEEGHALFISWVDAPHFFLYKNIIVQYIGMDYDLLHCLYQLCGNQIAGHLFIDSPLID